jgi:hypothetical protein
VGQPRPQHAGHIALSPLDVSPVGDVYRLCAEARRGLGLAEFVRVGAVNEL